jgi:hypothetical protein
MTREVRVGIFKEVASFAIGIATVFGGSSDVAELSVPCQPDDSGCRLERSVTELSNEYVRAKEESE